jgi:hypothetical protein
MRFWPAGVVTATVASVMSGPGDDYLAIYQLHAAAELYVTAVEDDWARFELPDGRVGWMRLDSIAMVTGAPTFDAPA